jgi:hypothetical protein
MSGAASLLSRVPVMPIRFQRVRDADRRGGHL